MRAPGPELVRLAERGEIGLNVYPGDRRPRREGATRSAGASPARPKAEPERRGSVPPARSRLARTAGRSRLRSSGQASACLRSRWRSRLGPRSRTRSGCPAARGLARWATSSGSCPSRSLSCPGMRLQRLADRLAYVPRGRAPIGDHKGKTPKPVKPARRRKLALVDRGGRFVKQSEKFF